MRSPGKPPTTKEHLTDKHTHVFDLVLSTLDLMEAIHRFRENGARGKDICHFIRCRLVTIVVPHVYAFPELIEWCASIFYPARRMVLLVDHRQPMIDVTP